jgi:hypothetical protein
MGHWQAGYRPHFSRPLMLSATRVGSAGEARLEASAATVSRSQPLDTGIRSESNCYPPLVGLRAVHEFEAGIKSWRIAADNTSTPGVPYWPSPGWLKIDPSFDPLRENLRF